jgi:hypothetical protein
MNAKELLRAVCHRVSHAGQVETSGELHAAALLLAEEVLALRLALDAAVPLLVAAQTQLEESCTLVDDHGVVIAMDDDLEEDLQPFRDAIALANSARIK